VWHGSGEAAAVGRAEEHTVTPGVAAAHGTLAAVSPC